MAITFQEIMSGPGLFPPAFGQTKRHYAGAWFNGKTGMSALPPSIKTGDGPVTSIEGGRIILQAAQGHGVQAVFFADRFLLPPDQ